MSTLATLLKESWSIVDDRADHLAQYLYARLFLADPNVRELFPVQMTEQRSRMLDALVAAVQTIDDPERFDQVMRALGRDHRRFHVRPEHYPLLGSALLDALRRYAGEQWSIEYDQAWRDAYDMMTRKMLTGAERDHDSPPFWLAEVIEHDRRGRDIAVLTCAPLTPYPFRAGQYASVESSHQPRQWRTYSIANAPRADGTLELHVRAPSHGWVSAALVRRTRVGDVLRLGPPLGTMTLDPGSTRDVVAVAGGTGYAAIKALVQEMARYNRSRWMHVFVGARNPDELYDLPALLALARRHPWLSVVAACSDDPDYSGETGPVHEVLERYGPWGRHDVFVCGPAPMVRGTLGSLARMGVAQVRIRYDTAASLADLGSTR
ncbi:MAG TPA: globin domain-containing protein [Micromonosporaceae bacterium]